MHGELILPGVQKSTDFLSYTFPIMMPRLEFCSCVFGEELWPAAFCGLLEVAQHVANRDGNISAALSVILPVLSLIVQFIFSGTGMMQDQR